MIRFSHYYGHDVWVMPARVLWVEDGGCGSRGLCAIVSLDNGATLNLLGRAEDIQRQIAKAMESNDA